MLITILNASISHLLMSSRFYITIYCTQLQQHFTRQYRKSGIKKDPRKSLRSHRGPLLFILNDQIRRLLCDVTIHEVPVTISRMPDTGDLLALQPEVIVVSNRDASYLLHQNILSLMKSCGTLSGIHSGSCLFIAASKSALENLPSLLPLPVQNRSNILEGSL